LPWLLGTGKGTGLKRPSLALKPLLMEQFSNFFFFAIEMTVLSVFWAGKIPRACRVNVFRLPTCLFLPAFQMILIWIDFLFSNLKK